jgi:hypothetical protein
MRRTTFGFLAAASTLALAASKATSPNIAAALKASAAGSSLRQEIHGCHYLRVRPAQGFRMRTSVPPALAHALPAGPLWRGYQM